MFSPPVFGSGLSVVSRMTDDDRAALFSGVFRPVFDYGAKIVFDSLDAFVNVPYLWATAAALVCCFGFYFVFRR